MRIVVALGGNALLRRGQALTAGNQRENTRVAAKALAAIAREHELVIAHGNGPQVGLLALQNNAYKPDEAYPLDVLVAETEGMIGYMIAQDLANELPDAKPVTVLTMIEVDPDDPAFADPTKFIGPVYERAEAERLAAEKGWTVKADGDRWRRVVPSPDPRRIVEIEPIRWLVEKGATVICSGGGGIPVRVDAEGRSHGVEAVIDKDFASALLARELDADLFVVATDADAVYLGWGTPDQRAVAEASPDALDAYSFAAGSMGPKVEAAGRFARATGRPAAIGALADVGAIVAGTRGTRIATGAGAMSFR